MRYQWFRFYSEVRNDAKLRTLDDQEFRIWVHLLCYANENQIERGAFDDEDRTLLAIEVANCDEAALQKTVEKLVKLRILEKTDKKMMRFRQFIDRQYDNESSKPEAVAKRVNKHRSRDKKLTQENHTVENGR